MTGWVTLGSLHKLGHGGSQGDRRSPSGGAWTEEGACPLPLGQVFHTSSQSSGVLITFLHSARERAGHRSEHGYACMWTWSCMSVSVNEHVSPCVCIVALTLTGWVTQANFLTFLCLGALTVHMQSGGVSRARQCPWVPLHFPASPAVRALSSFWSVAGSRVALRVWSS